MISRIHSHHTPVMIVNLHVKGSITRPQVPHQHIARLLGLAGERLSLVHEVENVRKTRRAHLPQVVLDGRRVHQVMENDAFTRPEVPQGWGQDTPWQQLCTYQLQARGTPPPNNINTAHRGRFQVNVNPIGDSK